MEGGGPSNDDCDEDQCDDWALSSPLLGGGEDIVSTLLGMNQTTLNYDSIPTSPMEQRKCLRKRGLCWDMAFVLRVHLTHIASAEWNSNGQGEAAVAAVVGTRALKRQAQLWDIIGWGVESDYAGTPYNVVLGANNVTLSYDPAEVCPNIFSNIGEIWKDIAIYWYCFAGVQYCNICSDFILQ